ncbi:unnamed protein product, partial [Amoebophrya sp. A120]
YGCYLNNCTTRRGYYCDDFGQCFAAKCGDGYRDEDIGETCDDFNTNNGDGCSSTCQIEPGFTCKRKSQFDADSCRLFHLINCKNECDDGNLDDSDGCDSNCRITTNYACESQLIASTNDYGNSTCHLVQCGDGIKEGTEACDDGNLLDLDGCSKDCIIEPGYACTATSTSLVSGTYNPSICSGICGDGRVVANETCDDANELNFDGCDENCGVEVGYKCLLTERPTKCLPICGDGVRIGGKEECDDGNTANSDGCSEHCKVELNWHCATPAEQSTRTLINELGAINVFETVNPQTQQIEIMRKYHTFETIINNDISERIVPESFTFGLGDNCKRTVCGDGLIEGQEECDDYNGFNYDGCSSTCKIE